MKVIHISTHDITGGAAVAATRLHLGMRAGGVDSLMLVADKAGDDPHTTAVHRRFGCAVRRRLDRLPLQLERARRSIAWRSLAWLPNGKLERAVREQRPDVVHLHWAQNGFVPLQTLARFDMPLVWTFHDLWPVCGAYHHEYDSDRRNPEAYTRANRPAGRLGFDLDKWTWKRKQRIYQRVNAEAAVPSHWMAEQVRSSALWRDRRVGVIPNGLDTSLFKPMDQAQARQLLDLPPDKVLILFGAMYAGSDPNKGYTQLREALDGLDLPAERTELAVFGMEAPKSGEDCLPYKTHWLGVLSDARKLATLYAAADVMVVPSLQESFGQTASEPMACGTPVVAFDTSGLKDIVEHQHNGYMARPFDPLDLAAGIRWVLEDQARHAALCAAARETAVERFDSAVVTGSYSDLYLRAIARAELAKPMPTPSSMEALGS